MSLRFRLLDKVFNAVNDKKGNVTNNNISVWVDGVFYEPWKNITISKDMDNLSGDFNFSFTDKWRQDGTDWVIVPDKEIVIKIGRDIIFSGFIESINSAVSSESRTLAVSGREKTCDLIDCSYIGKNEIKNTSFLNLANIVCKPYGISVKFETLPVNEPFTFKYEQGLSVYDALLKYATPRGYLLKTSSKGELIVFNRDVDTSVKSKTSLTQGVNILNASSDVDFSKRFSEYHVKGQASNKERTKPAKKPSERQTQNVAKVANQQIGKASDKAVTRHRPKLIISNDETTGFSVDKQARWEADINIRNSINVNVDVSGWRKQDGTLWETNEVVYADLKFLGISRNMLIKSVNFAKSIASGTITNLVLTEVDSFKSEEKSADNNVLKQFGWKTSGAVGTFDDVRKAFKKRLK